MNQLNFEKIVDKIERKYEVVVRMSIKAREMAGNEVSTESGHETKVTTLALNEYLRENHPDDFQNKNQPKAEQAE